MKKLRKQTHLLIIVMVFSMILTPTVYAGLVEDMVTFDRDYIPALALSNQPDKTTAQVTESLRRLNAAWEKFIKGLSQSDRENAALDQAIKESERKIDEAGKLISAGKRKEAHEALEAVRMGFWKARTAMGMDYLPDRLTAFHEPMEEFYDQSIKPGAEATKIKGLLSALSVRWSDVEKVKLNLGLFRFSEEKAARFADRVKKERQILTQLSDFIASGNKKALVQAAGPMKANFAQIYLLFGDFTGL